MTDPETVADVLAEMRSQNLLSTHDWADRIERAMAASAVPVATYTTGHCKNNAQPGGCQLHNLQCGYPSCDRQPVIPPAVPVESLGRDAPPYSAPFTTDVPQCCESPETCPEPCAPPPASVPDGFRIEVQYATEEWMTTAYTLVAPDHRRWCPAPGEPGYALLCALSATTPEPRT